MCGDGPDAAKNQPLNPSPSLVSNITGSTPVRPISRGAGRPSAGKYMSRRCSVQMSARTATTMTTMDANATIIRRLISMLVLGDRFDRATQLGRMTPRGKERHVPCSHGLQPALHPRVERRASRGGTDAEHRGVGRLSVS